MFPRRYVPILVAINGQQIQRYTAPTDQAHDFAAERYAHYRHELGEYRGSTRINSPESGEVGTHDRFERGYIFISD